MKKLTGRIRGVNTSGNHMYGYIADATITVSNGDIRVMSGMSRKNMREAIRNMWEDWKAMSKEDYGYSVYIVNEGNNIYS